MPTFNEKQSPVSFRSFNGESYCRQYVWNRDQSYDGEFFRESLHGDGTYKWKDSGVYEGGFYSNHKEGYAVMSFPDNSCFEVISGTRANGRIGLNNGNQRFGPGIFTHSNGRQDAGFWMGRKLVRLSRTVDYVVPRLAPTSAAKVKLLQFQRLIPINEEFDDSVSEILNMCSYVPNYLSCPYSRVIFDPRSYFFDKYAFEKTYFSNVKHPSKEIFSDADSRRIWEEGGEEEEEEEETLFEFPVIPSHCLCPDSEFKMKFLSLDSIDVCEKKESTSNVEMGILGYFTQYGALGGIETGDEKLSLEDGMKTVEEEDLIKRSKILAWNRSELCVTMLREIFRYRAFEGKLTFNIAKLMLGARTEFRRTGENEMHCLEFLKACALGSECDVKKMLCDYDISEELTDARGNNSVMFAAATDQHEIIDLVLDYGADVNSFNDESLTPLNLCLLRRLAQTFGLGNWETAFLPREIEKDDDYEVEEWRKRISIRSLDRIFGDGTSICGNKKSSVFSQENIQQRNFSSVRSTLSSLTGQPLISKHSLEMSSPTLSRYPKLPSLQSNPKKRSKTQMPKMDECNKIVNSSNVSEYFFELAPQGKQKFKTNESKRKLNRIGKEKTGEEISSAEDILTEDVIRRIREIDKTIEKLLKRGADPNISEVPKPSIHLGVYTKNLKIVNLLLSYGANPNCKLYPNEGLLTPLHVVVLSKPHRVYVDMCNVLLNFGANPEDETLPEFAYYPEEKEFLTLGEGRTPLQLLCMRPDLEYADPEGYTNKMALSLAKVSNRSRLYNGFTYPALAMFFGNVKLMKELISSKLFDLNEILGNDRGTILHVLVSTDYQKRTTLETSIDIYDYLSSAGANPLKRFDYPKSLAGNCIDYGYREVEEEQFLRKQMRERRRMSLKKSKIERDHLEDHIKLLEYMRKRIEREKSKGKKRGQGYVVEEMGEEEEGEMGEGEGEEESEGSEGGIRGKRGKGRRGGRGGRGGGKGGMGGGRGGRRLNELSEEKEVGEEKGEGFYADGKKRRSIMELDDEGNLIKKKKSESERLKEMELIKTSREGEVSDYAAYDEDDEDGYDEASRHGKSGKGKGEKKNGAVKAKKSRHTSKTGKGKNLSKKETGKDSRKDKKAKKQEVKDSKKRDANLKAKNLLALTHPSLLKSKAFNKFFGGKYLSCAETFPEKLRQLILKLIGNCSGLDIDDLLLPYVILRDGDLYYGFKGKGARSKGQYSLV